MKPFQLQKVLSDAASTLVLATDDDVDVLSGLTDCPVLGLQTAWREIEAAKGELTPDPFISNDTALLIYTSGSTGYPKGVVCPHAQVMFAVQAIAACLKYRPDDVVLSCLPLAFDYGLYQIFLSSLATAELALLEEDASVELLAHAHAWSATVIPLVPSLAMMLIALAARNQGAKTNVRLFTNTGSTLAPGVITSLRRCFPGAQVVPMFGTTECKRIAIHQPDGDLHHPGSVGLPLPDTEVLIVDESGNPLPEGEIGEIVVRGPHVMSGYWLDPHLSATRFRRSSETGEMVLYTGDYGRIDSQGFLYFAGRRDDIFKLHGMRVSTVEVETAVLDIPGVLDCTVSTSESAHGAIMWVVGDLEARDVLNELSTRLEAGKIPRLCYVVDKLPRTSHGKIDKAALATWFRKVQA